MRSCWAIGLGGCAAVAVMGLIGCGKDDGRPGADGTGGAQTSGVSQGDGGSADGASSGDTSDSNASADGSDGPSTGNGAGDDASPKFDLPPTDECEGSGLGSAFSYIWVANSAQGTVSKIDTETMEELGRYIVRPDSAGNPSRTSVNLNGDVAIANRYGGITKIYARNCPDSNGTPGVQSSTGAAEILAWGTDECVAWHAALPQYNVMRPVSWTAGTWDDTQCRYVGEKVWTTGAVANTNGSVVAMRLSGDDGSIEVAVAVPEIPVGQFGPYGGVTDPNGDFWFHSIHDAPVPRPLVRVAADGTSYEIFSVPETIAPYGIAVDASGRIWLAGITGGVARFSPDTATWDVNTTVTPGLGIMGAPDRMWIAAGYNATTGGWGPEFIGVVAVDVDSLEQVQSINLAPQAPQSHGVSVDFEGFVWMVDDTNSVYKIDPATQTWETYSGLTGPYTYSDMIGSGLSLVAG